MSSQDNDAAADEGNHTDEGTHFQKYLQLIEETLGFPYIPGQIRPFRSHSMQDMSNPIHPPPERAANTPSQMNGNTPANMTSGTPLEMIHGVLPGTKHEAPAAMTDEPLANITDDTTPETNGDDDDEDDDEDALSDHHKALIKAMEDNLSEFQTLVTECGEILNNCQVLVDRLREIRIAAEALVREGGYDLEAASLQENVAQPEQLAPAQRDPRSRKARNKKVLGNAANKQ